MNLQINFFSVPILDVTFGVDDKDLLSNANDYRELNLDTHSNNNSKPLNFENISTYWYDNKKYWRCFDYESTDYTLDRNNSKVNRYHRNYIPKSTKTLLERSSSNLILVLRDFYRCRIQDRKITRLEIRKMLACIFQNRR